MFQATWSRYVDCVTHDIITIDSPFSIIVHSLYTTAVTNNVCAASAFNYRLLLLFFSSYRQCHQNCIHQSLCKLT